MGLGSILNRGSLSFVNKGAKLISLEIFCFGSFLKMVFPKFLISLFPNHWQQFLTQLEPENLKLKFYFQFW